MSKPVNKKRKSVVSIVIDVILSIFMAFLAVIIICSLVEKATGKSVLGSRVMWIRTGSMEPTIPAESYIYTKDVKANEVKEGDVITFIVRDPTSPINGQYNTHRVVAISGNDFYTKGDNNPCNDAYPTKGEDIVAKYDRNLPVLTFFGRLYATPAGYVITMVGIAGLVALWFVIDHKEKKKQEKQLEFDKAVEEEVKRLEEEAKKNKKG